MLTSRVRVPDLRLTKDSNGLYNQLFASNTAAPHQAAWSPGLPRCEGKVDVSRFRRPSSLRSLLSREDFDETSSCWIFYTCGHDRWPWSARAGVRAERTGC